MTYQKSNFKSIGKLIEPLVRTHGSASIVSYSKLLNIWGTLVGENISETYETELETLSAWVKRKDTRNVLLSSKAKKLGFGYFQEPNGKIWWTLITGD